MTLATVYEDTEVYDALEFALMNRYSDKLAELDAIQLAQSVIVAVHFHFQYAIARHVRHDAVLV